MKFGIVGTGMIAGFHARALSEIPGTELAACFDTMPGRAEAFATSWSTPSRECRSYTDLDAFLRHPGLDVVTICTPSGAHLEPALAAARAGKHLVVEKPLEISSERCDRMIEACDKAGVTLSGIFPSRFHESARALKAAADSGRFGRLTMGNAYAKWWRDQEYYDHGTWKGTRALDGGGALMNQSIHAVDLLLWFMGPVTEVVALCGTVGHERIEVEDAAAASLRFGNGAIGTLQGTTAAWPGFLKRVEVSGLAGSAVMEEENIAFWRFRDESPADEALRGRLAAGISTGGGASDPSAIGWHGHRMQFEDIVRAIGTGGTPLVDGIEARRAVALVEAVYLSAATGRPVRPRT